LSFQHGTNTPIPLRREAEVATSLPGQRLAKIHGVVPTYLFHRQIVALEMAGVGIHHRLVLRLRYRRNAHVKRLADRHPMLVLAIVTIFAR